MKFSLTLPAFLAVLVAVPSTPIRSAESEPETELGVKMETMNGAYRAVRRQIEDASKNADSLARLAAIKEAARAAASLEPAKKADIPAARQAKFVADYQAKMKEFIGVVEKAEAALKAGNNAEAARLVGVMADTQKQAHGDFRKKK